MKNKEKKMYDASGTGNHCLADFLHKFFAVSALMFICKYWENGNILTQF